MGRAYAPAVVDAVCKHCGTGFTYEHRTGMRRRHCGAACRVAHQAARRTERTPPHARRPQPPRKANGRYVTSAGYVKLLLRDHPLADKNGHVYEHRLVAHRERQGHCPACFWCGTCLTWSSAVIDHLNENKADNTPSNLLVACNDCNRARGAMLPFIASMQEGAVQAFIGSVHAHRMRIVSACER